MKTLDRQGIIDSLIKYLPEISTSLLNLVNYLKQLINGDNPRNEQAMTTIIGELECLLDSIQALSKEVNIDTINIDESDSESKEMLFLCANSLKNLLTGIRDMLNWMRDESDSEEKLRKSVDLLFEAGQQIIELVNIITKK